MPLKHLNLSERSHVAEELLSYGPSELERRCLVIRQVVEDGDFSLEEALEAYGVTETDFACYQV